MVEAMKVVPCMHSQRAEQENRCPKETSCAAYHRALRAKHGVPTINPLVVATRKPGVVSQRVWVRLGLHANPSPLCGGTPTTVAQAA